MRRKISLVLSLLIGLSLVLGGCGNTSGSDEESGREGTSPTEKETIESIVESLPEAPGESLSDGAEESLPEEESMETAAGEYSTGGVWSEDGKLLYEDRFSTVSQETLEAMTTEEIFDVMMETVVARWHMSPLLYNFPSYLLTSMYEFFRTPEELMKRSDMVETVLEAYEEEEMLLLLPVTRQNWMITRPEWYWRKFCWQRIPLLNRQMKKRAGAFWKPLWKKRRSARR